MKYDSLLFDLDGTLTDPFEGITNSIIYALSHFGITETDRNKLGSFIGPPLNYSFEEYYRMDRETALKAVTLYRKYYEKDGLYENKLYPDIAETLKTLKEEGYRLIVATSKPEIFAKKILDHFGILCYFDYVAGATFDLTRVDKADIIRYAIEECKISDVSRAIMTGDRKHDIIGAKENGMKSVGVLYGYGSKEELKAAGADYIISTPTELAALMHKLNK